jgi:hypothetical protein
MEDAGEGEESLLTGSTGVPAFGASSLKKNEPEEAVLKLSGDSPQS